MRVIVSTCDKYDHLLPGFAMQWNRYWGIPVTVVGFRPPPPLPSNFSFHSLEFVETRAFTANLRRFIRRVREERLLFLFDDYWLTAPVNIARVASMESWLNIPEVVKVDLSRNTEHFAHTDLGNGLVEATKDAHYRTSTQPAIWRRDFLLKLLEGNMNPWQFELQSTPELAKGRIIGSCEQIVQFANVYYKGSPAPYMIDNIPSADLAELRASGAMDAIIPIA